MPKVNFHQKVIIFNPKNKFLVLKAFYKGKKWDLPGGAVEIPERHEEALRREVREEAGIEISNVVPLKVETGYNKDEDFYVIFIGYRCNSGSEYNGPSNLDRYSRWKTVV